MRDRQPSPGKEGRVCFTPDGGAPVYGVLQMADEPLDPGTDINKFSLLKDSTAALYGLDPSAVPDDVLSWIGGIGNLHHWYRRKYTYSYNLTAKYGYTIMGTLATADSIEIANTISVENGEVEFVNPTIQTNPTKSAIPTAVANAAPCWVRFNSHYSSGGSDVYSSVVFFFPEGTTGGTSTSDTINYRSSSINLGSSTVRAQEPTVVTLIGAWEELTSMDRSAYPDSGLVNHYEYAYVGKVFDAPSCIARIAVGGYVGTGTYGIDNPTVINLEFVPKILILYTKDRHLRTDSNSSAQLSYAVLTFGSSVGSMYFYDSTGRGCTLITNFDKTFSMYVEGSPLYPGAGSAQYNSAGTTYNYIAIG